MKFKITSKVEFMGTEMEHTYIHEFPDDSNVFGRVLDYHKHMEETFGKNRRYQLIDAKEINEKKGERK